MSYPLLRVTGNFARVEVRVGRGAQRWRDMEPIHDGPASTGTQWTGGEGDKLSAKHCKWYNDPNSTMSQPYSVSGTEGLGVGRPDALSFPSGMRMSLLSGEIAAPEDAPDPILHEDPRSGNCYKIKLTAALLGIPLETRQYDILKGETRTPEFRDNINAKGSIPVLQIGERFLPESNAACWYLAEDSALVPADPFDRADVLRWMFFEQSSHEPNIATLRFWLYFVGEGNLSDQQRAQIMSKRIAGEDALRVMDSHLATQEWLVGDCVSLADIVLFAYTHAAEAGGFALSDYPHIAPWIERVKALPNYTPME